MLEFLNEEIFMFAIGGTGYGFTIGSIIAIAIFCMIVIEGCRILKKGYGILKNQILQKKQEKDILSTTEES